MIALAPMPAGAAPSDAAVALSGYLAALPEAVAVMEAERRAVCRADGRWRARWSRIWAAPGCGLVAFDSGLNPARQVAGA